MTFLSVFSEDSCKRFARERAKIAKLNAFHNKSNTLPLSEEKATISLFRLAMGMDNYVEELMSLEEQIPQKEQATGKISEIKETRHQKVSET